MAAFDDKVSVAMHRAQDLVNIFNSLFQTSHATELVAGGEEPVYLPAAGMGDLHRSVFTQDYYASALHEISHWCIAGENRRRQVDYAYWYEPDGRSTEQQQAFEVVEIKPQALEWIFSAAAGVKFRVSVDNLNGTEVDTVYFFDAVKVQVGRYLAQGLPARAEQFRQALLSFYAREQAFVVFRDDLLQSLEMTAIEPQCLIASQPSGTERRVLTP